MFCSEVTVNCIETDHNIFLILNKCSESLNIAIRKCNNPPPMIGDCTARAGILCKSKYVVWEHFIQNIQ